MRLSLWQQFSSNHSASFRVVGEFKTREDALHAAEQFKEVFARIVNWRDTHPEAFDLHRIMDADYPATPVEIEIAKEYGIHWDKAIDWVFNALDKDKISQAVSSYESLVFVQNLSDTSIWEQPFEALMKKFTDRVFINDETARTALLSLTCYAPNDEVAATIARTVQRFFDADDPSIPWIGYHSGTLDPETDNLQRMNEIIREKRAIEQKWIKEFHEALRPLQTTPNSFMITPDTPESIALRTEWYRRREQMLSHLPVLSFSDEMKVLDANIKTEISTQSESKGVSQRDNELRFDRLLIWSMSTALPAFIAWLTDQGCTDIQYSLEQE
jgi:hypothetical protein